MGLAFFYHNSPRSHKRNNQTMVSPMPVWCPVCLKWRLSLDIFLGLCVIVKGSLEMGAIFQADFFSML